MSYTASPDEIVFDQNPGGKSNLLDGRPGYLSLTAPHLDGPPVVAAGKIEPDCLIPFLKLSLNFDISKEGVLYMHERTAASGRRYLVVVRSADENDLGGDVGQLVVVGQLFTLTTWDFLLKRYNLEDLPREAEHFDGFWDTWEQKNRGLPKRLRIYSGQSDPTNNAHFTIRYEEDGRLHIVDGFVEDKADRYLDPADQNIHTWTARVKFIQRPGH